MCSFFAFRSCGPGSGARPSSGVAPASESLRVAPRSMGPARSGTLPPTRRTFFKSGNLAFKSCKSLRISCFLMATAMPCHFRANLGGAACVSSRSAWSMALLARPGYLAPNSRTSLRSPTWALNARSSWETSRFLRLAPKPCHFRTADAYSFMSRKAWKPAAFICCGTLSAKSRSIRLWEAALVSARRGSRIVGAEVLALELCKAPDRVRSQAAARSVRSRSCFSSAFLAFFLWRRLARLVFSLSPKNPSTCCINLHDSPRAFWTNFTSDSLASMAFMILRDSSASSSSASVKLNGRDT
mmetsp:Transcript_69357/g.212635  ORF Transcript_69357/g.212635 Transcript_69357/m.212635 type:complete len:299 (+) Transcript_69357:215-1111(+)